jgi:hypothetical protein
MRAHGRCGLTSQSGPAEGALCGTRSVSTSGPHTAARALLGPSEGIEQSGGVDVDDAVIARVAGVLGDAVSTVDRTADDLTAALARLRRASVRVDVRRRCADPGEFASRRVTVTISSAAGSSSTSVTVSFGCAPTTEPSDETDPDTPSDPGPSQPAADG